MNTPGTLIDGKYTVINILSTDGGMGGLLKVVRNDDATELALKYCLSHEAEDLDRFRREIRLMKEFKGNSKVIQVIDSNLAYQPPYFVMPLYVDGDLRTLHPSIENDFQLQESVMLKMAECVDELHRVEKFHRDIKPANFLRAGDGIVLSDLGLGMDLLSRTGVTRTKQWCGTYGYLPREFMNAGGFKNATARSDIFMLGKAFYNLITGLDPQFIDKSSLKGPIFYLIDRCCKQNPDDRYQTIPDLQQGIVLTYDMVLGRMSPFAEAREVYEKIANLLTQGQYKAENVKRFVALAEALTPGELYSIIQGAENRFYYVLSLPAFHSELTNYLGLYEAAISTQTYNYSYAEIVADRMKIVFANSNDPDLRTHALQIAITMAEKKHRFAAMSTCSDIITSIVNGDPIEASVVAMLQKNMAEFLKDIEPVSCKSQVIADFFSKLPKSL